MATTLGHLPDDTRDANLAAARTSLEKLGRRVAAQDQCVALDMALARAAAASASPA